MFCFWNGIKGLCPKLSSHDVGLNFFRSQISTEAFLHMRYSGTDCALMCTAVHQKDTKVNSDFLIKVKKLIVINLVFPTFFLSLLLKEKVAPESLFFCLRLNKQVT